MTDPSSTGSPTGIPAPRQRCALHAVATSSSATCAADAAGVSLAELARDLVAVRAHYGVGSTRAALAEARRLGHVPPAATTD